MGILSRMLETRGYAATDDFWYTPIGHQVASKAGIRIDNDTAMRQSAVYACVKVLGESVGSLPCHLYERMDRGRERALDHWGYDLMHRQTGPRTPANQWLETAVFHMALTGNHYSLIDWTNGGEARQLVPLNPERVEVEVSDRDVVTYKFTDKKGKDHYLSDANVLHIPAFSWDGITGVSPIAYARETLGLAIATEEFGAKFFANGANIGTVYTLPEGKRFANKEEKDKFEEDMRQAHAGLAKAHKALILPAGMTASKVSIPPDDSQWLDSRKLNKAEIASIFRVPLHMIQEHEKNTSWGTGIESMSLGFVRYTLRPWLIRIEQMLNLKLLQGTDRERFYFEFMPEALLRGDMKSSGEFYQLMIQNKVMTPNEVREKLNMNPVDWGDEPVAAENIFGKSQDAPTNENPPDEQKSACGCGHEHRAEPAIEYVDHPRLSIQRSYRRVIRDAMARVIRREKNDIMRAAEKQSRKKPRKGETRAASLAEFIAEYYRAHEEFTREAITPAFTALAEAIGAEAMREIGQQWEWDEELEAWVSDYITAFANRHSNQSRGQLLQLLEEIDADADAAEVLSQRFEEWEVGLDGGRPRDDKIAARESVRMGQGFAREAFFAAGVVALVWVATGSETCPYCTWLDGRSVAATEFFITTDQYFKPPGATEPLQPHSNIGHPPAHSGCDCLIVPGG